MIWENRKIMNDMRKSKNYKWYEKIEDFWMIWECDTMNDMRISNYEWYENIKLWMIWEYKIMNDMRIYKLWKIWEYKIMKDMRM